MCNYDTSINYIVSVQEFNLLSILHIIFFQTVILVAVCKSDFKSLIFTYQAPHSEAAQIKKKRGQIRAV